jgi:hypothetical protein
LFAEGVSSETGHEPEAEHPLTKNGAVETDGAVQFYLMVKTLSRVLAAEAAEAAEPGRFRSPG